MNEKEFTEQRWKKVEKEERYFKLYPGLYIVVSIPENKGKAVIESEKYGKLELHFGLTQFEKVIDIEVFIINFFKDKL